MDDQQIQAMEYILDSIGENISKENYTAFQLPPYAFYNKDKLFIVNSVYEEIFEITLDEILEEMG